MGIYYVTHPNINISAKVEAPATEKARTTFLDYLERQGTINRADRQYWRRNMVAEKLDSPEDAFADLELYYGYQEQESSTPYKPQPNFEYEEPEQVEESISEPEPIVETRIEQRPNEKKLSPIAQKALEGYI